jgi:NADH-quinone oxidoreductase subunit N
MSEINLFLAMPVIALAAYGLGVLLLMHVPLFRGRTVEMGWFAFVGVLASGGFTFWLWRHWSGNGATTTASDMILVDGLGLFFSLILLAVTALCILGSFRFLDREEAGHPEFYALILFAAAGLLVMLQTRHMIMMLIGLEVFSLAVYVLTGLTRGRVRSVESALKYFLLGAFSSGFLVYGMALIYGATGSLDLKAIGDAEPSGLLWIGMGLLLIGLFFKIAVVPFHQWVPDVYQGAPTNVTGFMAAATKTAAFAVLLRVLFEAFGDHPEIWTPIITWLSIFTMTVANLMALLQRNLKRLLAFSSISHAGYLLIAVVCRPQAGIGAVAFYLTVYAFMTVGAFMVLAAVGRGDTESERGYDLSEWAGLGWRRPMLGLAMMIFLLSLAGIPPTGGFLGKYVIFQAAVESKRYMLAVIGVLNAVIGAWYYLKIIVAMYMKEPETDEQPPEVAPSMAVAMIVSVVAVLFLGLAPGRLLDLVDGISRFVL